MRLFSSASRGVVFALCMFGFASVSAQPVPPPPGSQACPAGQVMGSDFQCRCSTGTRRSNGGCVSAPCPPGRSLDPYGACTGVVVKPCPYGKERNNVGQCVVACLPPRMLDAAGRCT